MTQRRFGEPLPLGDDTLPYSKGLMARALIATGVPADRAYQLARALEVDLAGTGERTVGFERFAEVAREVLGDEAGEHAAQSLRRLDDLNALDMPLIVLIGGTTGTGKSTIASEVAHRLGITRVTSSDFIRETMRAFFSYEEMPAIHSSSFEAGAAVEGDDDPLIAGFVEQSRHVCVGVDAAMRRSLTEGWSMVLEGVHLVPGMVPASLDGALILHVIIEIANEDAHRMHFHVRDTATGGVRAMDKYLGRIDDIRRIQSFLVERAQREGVEVIENANVERAIDAVIALAMGLADRVGRPV
jgi:2-phosphoglycerate kinase